MRIPYWKLSLVTKFQEVEKAYFKRRIVMNEFYKLAKSVLKRKPIDVHLKNDQLYMCRAKEHLIAYAHISKRMVPLGIISDYKPEGKSHTRVELHPFDTDEQMHAANGICLCDANAATCIVHKEVKKKISKGKKMGKK